MKLTALALCSAIGIALIVGSAEVAEKEKTPFEKMHEIIAACAEQVAGIGHEGDPTIACALTFTFSALAVGKLSALAPDFVTSYGTNSKEDADMRDTLCGLWKVMVAMKPVAEMAATDVQSLADVSVTMTDRESEIRDALAAMFTGKELDEAYSLFIFTIEPAVKDDEQPPAPASGWDRD